MHRVDAPAAPLRSDEDWPSDPSKKADMSTKPLPRSASGARGGCGSDVCAVDAAAAGATVPAVVTSALADGSGGKSSVSIFWRLAGGPSSPRARKDRENKECRHPCPPLTARPPAARKPARRAPCAAARPPRARAAGRPHPGARRAPVWAQTVHASPPNQPADAPWSMMAKARAPGGRVPRTGAQPRPGGDAQAAWTLTKTLPMRAGLSRAAVPRARRRKKRCRSPRAGRTPAPALDFGSRAWNVDPVNSGTADLGPRLVNLVGRG